MSRAFVKENDLEHAGIDVPERPISSEKNYVTPNGHRELEVKISILEEERTKISLNTDSMHKQKKMQLERDLRYFVNRLESAILVNPQEQDKNKVLFSAYIDVENELGDILNFQIVGEDEANVKINKIAYNSPLAKALIGNTLDDEVVWKKPSGSEILTIVNIQYKYMFLRRINDIPTSIGFYRQVLNFDSMNPEALACLASHHFYTDQ